jgi:hypothetical protein
MPLRDNETGINRGRSGGVVISLGEPGEPGSQLSRTTVSA